MGVGKKENWQAQVDLQQNPTERRFLQKKERFSLEGHRTLLPVRAEDFDHHLRCGEEADRLILFPSDDTFELK